MHHLFWARNGIYHGLAALGVKPGDNVLVPSYHCTSLVEPILKFGSNAKFYDINTDLTPNFDDLKKKIDRKTRAILAVHYFGFPQPIRKFRELCDKHNLYLIEDCAHILTGSTREGIALGESGDISIFSWRKFLPIYDGGQMVINNPNLKLDLALDKGSFLFKLKVAKNTFERAFEDSRWGRMSGLSFLSKAASSVFKYSAFVNASAASVQQVNSYEVEFDLKCVNLEMSAISKHILNRTLIADVAEKRRRNYAFLAAAVMSMRGVAPLFPDLRENVCPWTFPFLVRGTKDFQLLLRAKGIPAASWGGVIHPSLPLQIFPKARFLYDHLVFLPIHQGMEERDLGMMIRVLGETLNESVGVDAKSFDDRVPLPAVSGR